MRHRTRDFLVLLLFPSNAMRRQCYKIHKTTPSGGAARFDFTGGRSVRSLGCFAAKNKSIHHFILQHVSLSRMTGIVDVSYQLPLQSCPRQCHPPYPPSQSWSPSPRYRYRSCSKSGGRHITRITQERKSRGELRATLALCLSPAHSRPVSQHLILATTTSSCDLKE